MNNDLDIIETNSMERIAEKILNDTDFNSMNNLVNKYSEKINKKFLFPHIFDNSEPEFVSVEKNSFKPYIKLITEEEFFKIVGATKHGLSKKSGIYQEKLYGHYLEALNNADEGYISDIFSKAIEFQTNLNYVKSLQKNSAFKAEWAKNFGNTSPVEVFKTDGSLRLVNIIKSNIEKR